MSLIGSDCLINLCDFFLAIYVLFSGLIAIKFYASGFYFKLSSCWSSSAMVDIEKVVSISSGDLLYRVLPLN